jgi:phospholipid/cholesterol/gamma-HCH transport system substrate-binding protein
VKTAIRKHAGHFAAVVGLALVAALVGGYIVHNQRMRFPWEGKPFELQAAFSTAQAVTPGQGQTVRVSGVRVGDITKVGLKDGHAVVTLALDPEYKDLVHTNATALLRPKTGLKDMFIELDPGTDKAPLAKRGWTLPVSNTLPDVNPDEILASLDSDTREYLTLLVDGAGRGLKGRGNDLREVFRRFEPTHRDLARVNRLVAQRHQNLSRLVHSLGDLNDELADKSDDLAALVDSSSAVFRSFASEQANVTRAVGDLPGALRQTTDTLGRVQRFAETLRPAAVHLQPALKALNRANGAVQPFAKEAAPIVQKQIRPFVRDARPVVRSTTKPADELAAATPDLTSSFTVLNHLFNLVGYNPNGREDPGKDAREEGYLFWIAWLQHNGASLFSTSDANGPFRAVTLGGTCGVLKSITGENPPLNQALLPALLDPKICGTN